MPNYADIPGLSKLQALTLGDPRITVAILDGRADLARACFRGANLTQIEPDWQEKYAPIRLEEYERFFAIANRKDGRSDEQKRDALAAAFSDDPNLLNRIQLACHATHIASILMGQPSSPVTGIAPHCKGVNIPIDGRGDEGEVISSLNLSYAFNRALVEGAHLIHCAACQPTRTGAVDELLQRTIQQGQSQNVVIIAPGGNDYGDCWCIPAALPGVLAVGAMRDDGMPFKFSNWGGMYQSQGVLAPGEKIWGAQPTNDIPVRHNGTSCAAPIVTGVAALLMSLQLQQGRPLDPEAVQAAILNSVIPCDPTDEEAARCLRGILNIQGAWSLLFDPPSLTISFVGDRVTPSNPIPSTISAADVESSDRGASEESAPETIARDGAARHLVHPSRDYLDTKTDEPATDIVRLENAPAIAADDGLVIASEPHSEQSTEPMLEAIFEPIVAADSDSVSDPISNSVAPNSPRPMSPLPRTPMLTVSRTEGRNAIAPPSPDSTTVERSVEITPSRPAPDVKDVQQFYDRIGQELGKEGSTYEGCFLLDHRSDMSLKQATNLFVAAQAGIQPGDYILDAACGAGGPSIDIAQQYPTVRIEGINLSEAQVDIAQTLVRDADLEDRVHVRVGDYHHLPYSDEVFDVVICLEASGFTHNRPKLLSEFFRVLRPGGTVYIKEWLQPERPLTLDEQAKMAETERMTLYTASKASEYEVDLAQAGFEHITIRDLSGILGTGDDWDTPICCGDIKAQRPGFTLRPSASSGAIATSNAIATTATDLAYFSTIQPSAIPISLVYALGTLGYDFGTEARRDSFKQLMPDIAIGEATRGATSAPANPYDARQMVSYLEEHLSEAQSLIWTLNLERTPLYALLPTGPFAREIYAQLCALLAGHGAEVGSEAFVEHVSIPGFLTDRTVRLFSGQVVPVVDVRHLRGMYGWQVNDLVQDAVGAIQMMGSEVDADVMETALVGFLNRVYFDLRNLGKVSRDRALNFAVTNVFQAASTFADAISLGMQLDSIGVEKSPFCRRGSDCWDVKLKFFDPEDSDRARKIYRFTIDVSDIVPVTLGDVRSWSVSK